MSYRLKARERAIDRGMRFVAGVSSYEPCLAHLGSGLLFFCSSLARTAPPALRNQGLAIGRVGFSYWRGQMFESADGFDASVVSEWVRGYGAAEAFRLRYPSVKAWLTRYARGLPPVDFFGFDPRVEPPPIDIPDVCVCGRTNARGRRRCQAASCRAPLVAMAPYRVWCLALISAYCGERYGVRLGSSYRDVFRWLPAMRPYWAAAPSDAASFADLAYSITHIVYTLNDFGRHLLSPRWLPSEYEFLRTYLEWALAANDPDMAGEFVETLRAFGVQDDDRQARRGFDFLLDTQNADGSWGVWDADTLYTGFHATWAAIDGLREFTWNGPRLAFPTLLPWLTRWARAGV